MLKRLITLPLAAFLAVGLHADAPVGTRPGVSPDKAWHLLSLGNDRFATGLDVRPHLDAARRRALTRGQRPWAVVVTDSDSRLTPEFIFDLGLGDLYVVRLAGGVIQSGVSADSVSYAVENLGPRLVVVLGDASSGVVRDALKGGAAANSAKARLAGDIKPAVDQARDRVAGLSGSELDAAAVERNVLLQMQRVLELAPAVADGVRAGRVKVIGGIYDLGTGRVRWLGEHPDQAAILAGKRP